MPCAQYQQLVSQFPQTTANIQRHFLPDLINAKTDQKGHNVAGYVLYQLNRAARHAMQVHGPHVVTMQLCDKMFCSEVQYHADRKTTFRNFVPAIGTCIYNSVHERAERWQLPIANRSSENVSSIAEVFGDLKRKVSS